MYFLGIDGGATSTKFSLMNNENNIVCTVEKGPCHVREVGFNGFAEVINEGLIELLSYNSIDKSEIAMACAGISGFGRSNEIDDMIKEKISECLNGIKHFICSNYKIAHIGALEERDGIILICSAGSVCYSHDRNRDRTVGGWSWGHSLSDDGSGFWIGKKTIQIFLKEIDGRLAKSPIYYLIKDKMHLDDDSKFFEIFDCEYENRKREISKFARICCLASEIEDKYAKEILEDASSELALSVNTLVKDFENDVVDVAYSGKVFDYGDSLYKRVIRKLDPRVNFIKAKHSPVIGACWMAKKKFDKHKN